MHKKIKLCGTAARSWSAAALLAVSVSGTVRGETGVFPMPEISDAPKGQNSAAYPLPRLEWFARVKTAIEKSQKQKHEIRLIFDGDSITDGWQGVGKNVWARFAKYHAFDFGLSGDRTQHLLWRLEQGQADGLRPKLVAVMIGTNNLYANAPEEIAGGIKLIVSEYQKKCPDAVILLQAVFPRGEKADDPARAKIKAINDLIAKYGDGEKIIYADFGEKFLNADGSMSREVMGDFLHPTEKGYQIWADAIQPLIDRYVK